MANTNKRVTYIIEINDKGKAKVEGLTKGFVQLDNAVKKVSQDLLQQGNIMEDNAKKNQKMIDKTGLAGAAMIEIGRTISDSNYGFRAMANNISQLSTLMVTLMMTSGGLVGGLKQLWKAAAGPVGLIVAFQVVIAMLEKASMNAKRFEDSLETATDKILAQRVELMIYSDVLRDVTSNEESREEAIRGVLKVLPDLTKEELLSKEGLEDLNLEIEEYIENQLIRAEITSMYAKNEENFRLVREINQIKAIENEKQRIAAMKTFLKDIGKMGESISEFGDIYGFFADFSQDPKRAIMLLSEWIEKVFTKTDEDILKGFNLFSGRIVESTEKAIQGIRDLFAKITKDKSLKEKVEKDTDKLAELIANYKQKLKEAEQVSKAEVLREQRDFVLRTARELGASIKQLDSILAYYDIIIGRAIDAEIASDIKANTDRQLDGLKLVADRQKEIFNTAKKFTTELSQLQTQSFAAQEKRLDNERQIILNNDNLTSKEKNRLLIENDKKTRAVQLKKIKFDRDLFMIEQAMELKKLALKIKAHLTELTIKSKGSVADGLMSIGEFVRQLGPLGVAAYAVSIGGIVAAIVSARNKAKQEIAALAGPAAGVVSGSGGGDSAPSIQAPSFNVVGATQTSQLAQTIAGSEEQPLRAYVVASDISTAQELERSTIEGASMG